MGYIPGYFDFVDKVEDIFNLPIEPEGTKPRTFLQKAGDICREGNPDCFAMWGIIKASKLYQSYYKSLEEEEAESPFAVIISDVRFVNEAEAILKQPNGVLVCFDASDETLQERIYKRDGKLMSEEQMSHKSEQEIKQVMEMASVVIRTDGMSIEEQALETIKKIGLLQEQNA